MMNHLDIPSMLGIINNNGTDLLYILNTRYTKAEVDTLISTSYNKAGTGKLTKTEVGIYT